MKTWLWWIIGGLLVTLTLGVIIEILIIKFTGSAVAVPSIPRDPQQLGRGQPLRYVIMGDSTAIGQGAPYTDSYAIASANHLAETHAVTWINLGVSGARIEDVADNRLPAALAFQPDIVLLAVGANDVTHATSLETVRKTLVQIIERLRSANPAVRIVVTGAPDMGSVPRLPWPVQQLAGLRTRQVNQVFQEVAAQHDLTFAPIAEQTGPAFRADPSLFTADKFHPNSRGYALWTPVINNALDSALQ